MASVGVAFGWVGARPRGERLPAAQQSRKEGEKTETFHR